MSDEAKSQVSGKPVWEIVADLQSRLDKSLTFKTFVHTYLNRRNIPHGDPENQHQKEGCRIGARLDLVFAQLTAAQARVKELEQEQAALTQALKVEYNGPNDKMSGDLVDDLTCFVEHHKKKEHRITTLEQALRAANNQILELINGGASLLAHMPDTPLLSDAGTAQSFLRIQIVLAKQALANISAALNEKEGK